MLAAIFDIRESMTASSELEHLRLAQQAVAAGRWADAVAHAQAILNGSPPEVFFPALQLTCWAQANIGGKSAARNVYVLHAAAIWRMLALAAPDPAWLRGALDAAILVEDFTTIRALFNKIYQPAWEGIDVAVSPHMPLTAWSQASGVALATIDPAHAEADPHGRWRYEAEAVTALAVDGAEVLLGWDFVVTPTGVVLNDSGYASLAMTHAACPHYVGVDRVVHSWQPAAVDVDADVLVMSAPPDLFIGHWIIDFLPRLRALPAASDFKIVIPDELPQKLRDLLALFGIVLERLMPLPRGRRYRFRRALVVHTGDPHKPSAATVQFVGNALRAPEPTDVPRLRLHLLRDTAARSIANRVEVDALLVRYGFETAALATLSIADQRERLGRAEIVIATYGSDLLANLFMPPGAHLIELNYDPAALDAGAAPRSAFLAVDHHLLTCRRAAHSAVTGHRKDSDFLVDCVALETLLRDILVEA